MHSRPSNGRKGFPFLGTVPDSEPDEIALVIPKQRHVLGAADLKIGSRSESTGLQGVLLVFLGGCMLLCVTNSAALLKFQCACQSPGELVQMQITGHHPQRFGFSRLE